jgi:hypothetical protein
MRHRLRSAELNPHVPPVAVQQAFDVPSAGSPKRAPVHVVSLLAVIVVNTPEAPCITGCFAAAWQVPFWEAHLVPLGAVCALVAGAEPYGTPCSPRPLLLSLRLPIDNVVNCSRPGRN